MAAFGEQPISEADGLDRFIVINGTDFNPGVLFEAFKDRFGIGSILGAVNNDGSSISPWSMLKQWKEDRRDQRHYRKNPPPKLSENLASPELVFWPILVLA
jgi:hypothetical protein